MLLSGGAGGGNELVDVGLGRRGKRRNLGEGGYFPRPFAAREGFGPFWYPITLTSAGGFFHHPSWENDGFQIALEDGSFSVGCMTRYSDTTDWHALGRIMHGVCDELEVFTQMRKIFELWKMRNTAMFIKDSSLLLSGESAWCAVNLEPAR